MDRSTCLDTYHGNKTPPVVTPNKKPAELTEKRTEPSQSNFLSFSMIFPGIWACFKNNVTKSIPTPTMGKLIQNIHLQDFHSVSFFIRLLCLQ